MLCPINIGSFGPLSDMTRLGAKERDHGKSRTNETVDCVSASTSTPLVSRAVAGAKR